MCVNTASTPCSDMFEWVAYDTGYAGYTLASTDLFRGTSALKSIKSNYYAMSRSHTSTATITSSKL